MVVSLQLWEGKKSGNNIPLSVLYLSLKMMLAKAKTELKYQEGRGVLETHTFLTIWSCVLGKTVSLAREEAPHGV